jgi:dCTP deaminase
LAGFWSSETLHGRLPRIVTPFDPEHVVSCAYELSLGSEVFITAEETSTKRELQPGEQICIPPGQFANLLTAETLKMPADAIGLISIRFTLKQPGLVNISGFHVDPGYLGNLLFSVYNAGPSSAIISQGSPVFLLWLCDLNQTTGDIRRKPARTGITDAEVSHLQGEIATPQALAKRVDALEKRVGVWHWAWRSVVAAALAVGVGALITLAVHAYDPGPPSAPTTSTTTSTSTP